MKELQNILDSLNADNKILDKVEFKKKYLSKEGLITIALKGISEISKEEKATYGKRINEIKDIANTYLQQKEVLIN